MKNNYVVEFRSGIERRSKVFAKYHDAEKCFMNGLVSKDDDVVLFKITDSNALREIRRMSEVKEMLNDKSREVQAA